MAANFFSTFPCWREITFTVSHSLLHYSLHNGEGYTVSPTPKSSPQTSQTYSLSPKCTIYMRRLRSWLDLSRVQARHVQVKLKRVRIVQKTLMVTRWLRFSRSLRCVHYGEKPHVWPVCGRGFGRSEHLRRHIRVVHNGEKLHQCPDCGKAFALKTTMKRPRS